MQKSFVCRVRLSNQEPGGYKIEEVAVDGYEVSIESQDSDSTDPMSVVCKVLISKAESEDDRSLAEVLSFFHYILWILAFAAWIMSYASENLVARGVAFIAFLFASYDFFVNHFKRIKHWGFKALSIIAFVAVGLHYGFEIWGWLKLKIWT